MYSINLVLVQWTDTTECILGARSDDGDTVITPICSFSSTCSDVLGNYSIAFAGIDDFFDYAFVKLGVPLYGKDLNIFPNLRVGKGRRS